MKQDVANAIEELKQAFPSSRVWSREDGSGGAYVMVEDVFHRRWVLSVVHVDRGPCYGTLSLR